MSTSSIFLYGIGIQVIGIGFGLAIAKSGLPFGPYIAGAITIVMVALLLSKALKTIEWTHLIAPAIVWSLAYVIIFQALGFLWFPGLVKDLELFSMDHLLRAGVLFVILSVVYVGELGILKFILAKSR